MKRLAVALAILALLGVGAANATNPPPRRAYPAKGNLPAMRVLMLRCLHGDRQACSKLTYP